MKSIHHRKKNERLVILLGFARLFSEITIVIGFLTLIGIVVYHLFF
ncbi:MAG: hypothetical protein ACMXYE_00115 [Candidatus Woesearchaeota archaeon]